MEPLLPFGALPDAKDRNLRRIKRWDGANKTERFLLAFIWVIKLFLAAFLTACCVFANAIILAVIPFIIGLKFLVTPPFGIRNP